GGIDAGGPPASWARRGVCASRAGQRCASAARSAERPALSLPGTAPGTAAPVRAVPWPPCGRYRSAITMTISRTGGIVPPMKFTLEPGTRANLIRGYSAAEIRIGEQRVQRSCIVTADRLITDWEPES